MNKIFISYSHIDKDYAIKVNDKLLSDGIDTVIDYKDLEISQNIDEFIVENIGHTSKTILIVSESSLLSQWVIKEALTSFKLTELVGRDKIIVCYTDQTIYRKSLANKIIEKAQQKEKDLIREITTRANSGLGIRDLQDELERTKNLCQNIDLIFKYIKESYSLPIDNKNISKSLTELSQFIKNDSKTNYSTLETKKNAVNAILNLNIKEVLKKISSDRRIKTFQIQFFKDKLMSAQSEYKNGLISIDKFSEISNNIRNSLVELIFKADNTSDLNIFSKIIDEDQGVKKQLIQKNLSRMENLVKKWVKKFRQRISIVTFDIDGYTSINQRHGFAIGDIIKIHTEKLAKAFFLEIENSIKNLNRNKKFKFHWLGKDEFCILINGYGDVKSEYFAEEFRRSIMEYDWSKIKDSLYVTISGGIAELDYSKNEQLERCILRSLFGIQEAKINGKNKVVTIPGFIEIDKSGQESNIQKKREDIDKAKSNDSTKTKKRKIPKYIRESDGFNESEYITNLNRKNHLKKRYKDKYYESSPWEYCS